MFQLELEPDSEKQHQNAQVRHMVQRFPGVNGQTKRRPEDIDGKPRCQKANQGRQANLTDGQTEKEGETDGDNFKHCTVSVSIT